MGHGSKARGFDSAMKQVARDASKLLAIPALCAYLGSASPSIPDGVKRLKAKGIQEIIIVPYFVLSGFHVTGDIPEIVTDLSKQYRGQLRIKLSGYLGYDALLSRLVAKRARAIS